MKDMLSQWQQALLSQPSHKVRCQTWVWIKSLLSYSVFVFILVHSMMPSSSGMFPRILSQQPQHVTTAFLVPPLRMKFKSWIRPQMTSLDSFPAFPSAHLSHVKSLWDSHLLVCPLSALGSALECGDTVSSLSILYYKLFYINSESEVPPDDLNTQMLCSAKDCLWKAALGRSADKESLARCQYGSMNLGPTIAKSTLASPERELRISDVSIAQLNLEFSLVKLNKRWV